MDDLIVFRNTQPTDVVFVRFIHRDRKHLRFDHLMVFLTGFGKAFQIDQLTVGADLIDKGTFSLTFDEVFFVDQFLNGTADGDPAHIVAFHQFLFSGDLLSLHILAVDDSSTEDLFQLKIQGLVVAGT